MPKVSVVVITKNEESRIARALRSVRALADEIIVVDDHSSDRTCAIVRDEFGAKVFVRPLNRDFAAQRNFGADQASNEWVLAMDADEVYPASTIAMINAALQAGGGFGLYEFRRVNHFIGQPLKHCGAEGVLASLYRRPVFRFEGAIHERLSGEGIRKFLGGEVFHHPFDSVDDFIVKWRVYLDIEAEKYCNDLAIVSWKEVRYRITWKTLKIFFKLYFRKKGFWDGPQGLVWCILNSIGPQLKWVKIWEKAKIKGILR